MQAEFGSEVAKALQRRIGELHYVESMDDLLAGAGRWEELTGDRSGTWSARLSANWRLIVRPEPGSAVLVVEIVDYHRS
jgi:proteic killer suppression protein